MKLAVMQPYLFPYIGYFQLMSSVDRFVIYDDVTFIKQGWINRNRIRIGDQAAYLTVPVRAASSFDLICNVRISEARRWQTRLLRTISQAYARAPHFPTVFDRVEALFRSGLETIADLARRSVLLVRDYLAIPSTIVETSAIYQNRDLSKQQRVLDICRREGCRTYVNAPGGRALYSRDLFALHGIDLRFLKAGDIRYAQGDKPFLPDLSILDVLMWNPPDRVQDFLTQCTLE
ncbi:MAG TPA: WbqC family protein [Pirellulales bacterium]|nr:WbqC family protein [Pirellulales bacterium]